MQDRIANGHSRKAALLCVFALGVLTGNSTRSLCRYCMTQPAIDTHTHTHTHTQTNGVSHVCDRGAFTCIRTCVTTRTCICLCPVQVDAEIVVPQYCSACPSKVHDDVTNVYDDVTYVYDCSACPSKVLLL